MKGLDIRWLIRIDMPAVLEIERACFEQPWSEEDFLCCLRQRNFIGMVAETGPTCAGTIHGFMVYELHKPRLRIVNFAVSPDSRRRGVGRAMVEKLKCKLSQQRRTQLDAPVRETNLSAQLFFQAMQFTCQFIERGRYTDTDEAAYWFRYRIGQPVAAVFRGVNRISGQFSEVPE